MNRGVMVARLLQSDIFEHNYDSDLWPTTNLCGQKVLKHYNGSKFDLRNMYSSIFETVCDDTHEQQNDDSKIYKIGYCLNLLPNIDESSDSLMEACGETDELEIFECKVLIDFIEFKWN
jgi:hypothetical protein